VEVYIGGDSALVMATRTIEEGEALTIDYGQPVVGTVKWCSSAACKSCGQLDTRHRDEPTVVASSVSDDVSR
jgi:hypothetical protein